MFVNICRDQIPARDEKYRKYNEVPRLASHFDTLLAVISFPHAVPHLRSVSSFVMLVAAHVWNVLGHARVIPLSHTLRHWCSVSSFVMLVAAHVWYILCHARVVLCMCCDRIAARCIHEKLTKSGNKQDEVT